MKGAPKLYLIHCSCVATILFYADLVKSVFSTCSFGKLVFCLSLNSAFSVSSVLIPRGGSRTLATSKTKRPILDAAAVLDSPLNPMSSL